MSRQKSQGIGLRKAPSKMFTTFMAAPVPSSGPNDDQDGQNRQLGQDQTSSPLTAIRLKRNQVARACDWCRLNRVRCDKNQPCFNCQSRGGTCCKNGIREVQSLPDATKCVPKLQVRNVHDTDVLKRDRETEGAH